MEEADDVNSGLAEASGTSYENDILSFGEAYDWYTRAIYDAEAIADGFASTLRDLGAKRVLDCAAGTGVPALHLAKKYGRGDGLLALGGSGPEETIAELVCSDGTQTMVDQFNRNAESMGLTVRCDLVDWKDLTTEDPYDFVLCRGNSLVYATTWDGGQKPAGLTRLQSYLTSFASVLRPSGHLQIDAPRRLDLPVQTKQVVSRYEHASAFVEVIEEVSETGFSRRWQCAVNVDERVGRRKTLEFSLYSTKLTIDDLQTLLEVNGFKTVDRFQLDGDRPGHMTILAQLMKR